MIKFNRITQALFSAVFLLSVGCSTAPTEQELIRERIRFAGADYNWLGMCPPDLSHPLTLNEIVKIATERNLELFVKEREYAIQVEKVTRQKWLLLPSLNYNLTDTIRNKNTAALVDIANPPPNNAPPLLEIGLPKDEHVWNLSLLWNIMDFGVSYYRVRQETDRAIVQSLEYERIRQSVILRLVTAYWRAVAAKRAMERAQVLIPEMAKQTERLNRELNNKVYLTKDQALSKLVFFYQREMEVKGFNDRPDSSDPTQGYAKEYDNAMLDLASLMQLPPGAHFELVMPEDFPYEVELPDLKTMFDLALINRPELYERDREFKIGIDDIYVAIIQELPIVQLFINKNHDSNRYLLFNDWYQTGLTLAWNLLQIPVHTTDQNIGVGEADLAIRSRLLLSESIITQVALAFLLLQQNQEQFLIAKNWANAAQQVAELSVKESIVGKKSKLEALQSRIDAALALNNATKIYAELQNNVEQLNNAIGIPLYFYTANEDQGYAESDTDE
jgi:outer membrane protein TolC